MSIKVAKVGRLLGQKHTFLVSPIISSFILNKGEIKSELEPSSKDRLALCRTHANVSCSIRATHQVGLSMPRFLS